MKYSTLTTAQRAKVRKVEKAHDEATRPIHQAIYSREQEVRLQAWKELGCAERLEALDAEYRPLMAEIEEQRKALWAKYQELSGKLSELRLDIQTEPYQAVYADPQYNALRAISKQAREAHEATLTQLISEFENANKEAVA